MQGSNDYASQNWFWDLLVINVNPSNPGYVRPSLFLFCTRDVQRCGLGTRMEKSHTPRTWGWRPACLSANLVAWGPAAHTREAAEAVCCGSRSTGDRDPRGLGQSRGAHTGPVPPRHTAGSQWVLVSTEDGWRGLLEMAPCLLSFSTKEWHAQLRNNRFSENGFHASSVRHFLLVKW